ncbi:MAG TPA: amino acid permease, partial [Candidatus Eisenbacteria bacterium]|nr:amino acid permease [Candidatus Eisenbacteria bacterium]
GCSRSRSEPQDLARSEEEVTGVEPLLRRQIGLYAATAVTVGSIIGSGIFRSPHSVARELPSEGLMLAAWIVGGLLSMVGALALAELAVAHPRTGGLYVFIREGFGRRLAFVFGWASLSVIKPTVIASITSVFALYFCEAAGLAESAQLPVGIGAIGLLTLVNWLGVKEGTRTQTLFTTLKVAGILLLCFAAFALPHRGPLPGAAPAQAAPLDASPLWLAFVAAMIPILFAYDGWTDSTYVAGEIVRPRRNLPIAIVGGTAIVIAIYVLTNLAYFAVLTPAEVAAHEAVGSETVRRILGEWGGRALAVLVSVSTFGTISASILTGPRVTLAMASDGLFWKRAAHVDARRGSPDVALWLQCVLAWIWLAVAVEGFEDVSGWFVTTSWLFYGLTIAAVLRLRGRDGASSDVAAIDDAGPGYRTPLYPVTPVLFILVTLGLIASDLAASQWRAAAGILVAALGFPIYHIWKGRSGT